MTTEDWHADININDKIAQKLIHNQFNKLNNLKVEFLAEGWDNRAYLVDNQFIFRFPRRKKSASMIAHENTILEYLQDKTNLAIPCPIFYGEATDEFPFTFHGYKKLPGISGCHAHLTIQDRANSIKPIAKFLRTLHNIDCNKAKNIGIKPTLFNRANIDNLVDKLNNNCQKINQLAIASINSKELELEISNAKNIILPNTQVLVHGDLYCRHLLFSNKILTGIIDWGDSGINTPAVDLSVLYSFYPQSSWNNFFDIYGDIDKQTLDYSRYIALHITITLLLYSYKINDKLLHQEVKTAINNINPNLQV